MSTVRTEGGHRRVAVSAVVAFLRQQRQPLLRPELLGLPANTGRGEAVIDRGAESFRTALLAGDEDQARRVVFDLYLAQFPAYQICQQVISASFHTIGHLWECGNIEVFEEHRACEICMRLLFELRLAIPRVADNAPLAIGGSAEHDPYRLPTTMVEITLRELGWRAESYGSRLPIATLAAAVERTRPQLVWLSVSHLSEVETFLAEYAELFQIVQRQGAKLVVGGVALTEAVRDRMQYSAFCDTLAGLVSFLEFSPSGSPPAAAPPQV